MKYCSESVCDTYVLAGKIADKCIGGEVILLNGDLGAGKTTFTKGLAEALGITTVIKSPTFTLMKKYTQGRLPLYHFDLYRVESEEEVYELGFDDYLENNDGICVIEWNKFSGLNKNVININIAYNGETGRTFEITFSADIEKRFADLI